MTRERLVDAVEVVGASSAFARVGEAAAKDGLDLTTILTAEDVSIMAQAASDHNARACRAVCKSL